MIYQPFWCLEIALEFSEIFANKRRLYHDKREQIYERKQPLHAKFVTAHLSGECGPNGYGNSWDRLHMHSLVTDQVF